MSISEDIKNLINKYHKDYYILFLNSDNLEIKERISEKSPTDLNLNCNYIVQRNDTTVEILQQIIENVSVNFFFLSNNKNLTIDFIKKYHDENWNWYILTKLIPYKDIVANPNLPWISSSLKMNPTVPIEYIIKKYSHKPFEYIWDTITINMNENNINNIIENKELPWVWKFVYNAPIKFILENRGFDWNYSKILTIVSLNDIKKYLSVGIQDWHSISINPNLTLPFIEKHIYKINFSRLSINEFTYLKKLYILNNFLIEDVSIKILDFL